MDEACPLSQGPEHVFITTISIYLPVFPSILAGYSYPPPVYHSRSLQASWENAQKPTAL